MIEIRPMRRDEFPYVMDKPHIDYTEALAAAEGISYDDAKEMADAQVGGILTDGFDTAGQHFFTIESQGAFAGFAWIQIKEDKHKKTAWGFNIYIGEAFRRQGLAKKTLEYLTPVLRGMGVTDIAFQVYAHNHKAIALYRQFGLETTNLIMKRKL